MLTVRAREVATSIAASLDESASARIACLVSNAVLIAHALPFLRAAHAAGVRVALLKGAALLTEVYPDWGTRLMSDVDLLVERSRVERAFELLAEAGFAPAKGSFGDLARSLRVEHAFELVNAHGGRIDLHWNPLRAAPWSGHAEDHWAHARTSALEGVPVWRLDPADELFIVCAHAAHDRVHRGKASAHWAADAISIVRHHALDWDRLASVAASRGFAHTIARDLTTLARAFEPRCTPHGFTSARPHPAERCDAIALRLPTGSRESFCEAARFLRMRVAPRYRNPVRGPLRYLADAWSLGGEREAATALLARLATKIFGRNAQRPW